MDDITCSESCLGNTKESCGGSYQQADPAVAFYERANGMPANPSATVVYSAVIMTRTISSTSPSSTGGLSGGNGDGGAVGGSAGVRTASSTRTATKSGATATKPNAGTMLKGSEALYSVGSFSLLSIFLGVAAF